MGLAVVGVAVDGEEHSGFDLRETVDHGGATEVGRARRPHRADAGAGQEGDQRFGDVGHVGHDAVAFTDAEPRESCGDGGDRIVQLGPTHLAQRPRLRGEEQGRLVRPHVPEGVRGVVELGPGEPLGAGHGARAEYLTVRRRRLDVEVVP